MNRSEALSVSKLELARSPYLESFSASHLVLHPKYRKPVTFGDDLCQVISERKRAQSIVKELQRRIASFRSNDSKRKNSRNEDTQNSDQQREQKLRSLEALREKVRRESEGNKMRLEEQKEKLLQLRRVTAT